MTSHDGTDPSTTSFLTDGTTTGKWELVSARSSVQFKTKSMWGLVPVKGKFNEIQGEVLVGPEGAVSGSLSIATSSLDTGNKKRDKHLRSNDFFDTDRFPTSTFRLTGISGTGSHLEATGTLTVGTKSQLISFPATVVVPKEDEIDVTATTVVDRSEYGLTWNQMGASSMKNDVTVRAVFVRLP
jgi:polyisoprenoid-binding protein YceI